MGWFSSKKNDETDWNGEAEKYEKRARDARAKAAKYRKALREGSNDPAADRSVIQRAEAEQATAEHNARFYREGARRR